MVQINFRNILRTCLRRLWLEELLYRVSAQSNEISVSINSDRLELDKIAQNNIHELNFEEKLQASLTAWSHNGLASNVNLRQQFGEEIYAMLSNITLKPENVATAMVGFITNEKTNPVILFTKLADFYHRWCDGEFIDAVPEQNLPQKQMLRLQEQNVAIGLRRIDINTGLNVMILLLELHRVLRSQNHHLQAEISFYPSSQPDTNNFFTSRLLRVINYSDSIEIGNFSNVVGAFLANSQLEGVYLGDANLSHVNFSGANLSGAYLGDANLTGLQAAKINLSKADLGDANLSGADLRAANLTHSDLTHCNLSGADLSGTNLSHADLSNANLAGANLVGANLAGANLTSVNLRDANLSGANLQNAILFGANLSDSNLIGAEISYADLCRADLSGVNLRGSTLKGTNLSDSILFGTNLRETILIAADLSYAKLNGANLNGANLQAAIILGADLSGVDLSQVILNAADLSGVNLSEANLSGVDLSEAVLIGTDLSYANLHGANLSSSNLSGANFNGANLSHTNLSYAILSNTDLSAANLADTIWNENLTWDVRGLDKAVNIPPALKAKFKPSEM